MGRSADPSAPPTPGMPGQPARDQERGDHDGERQERTAPQRLDQERAGLIAQEQNEDERAMDLFNKAIQLVPTYSFAHVALGSTYLKLKNYRGAQQELEVGVKLNPNDSKAHYNLAVLYARLKDPQRAQEEMRIVEKLKKGGRAQEKEGDTLTPSTPKPR